MIFLKGIWQATSREVNRAMHSVVYLSILFLLPALAFGFFALFFEKGLADNLPIVVVDEDHSELSRKVVEMVDETAAVKVACQVEDMATAMSLVRSGKVYAVLQIPSDFEEDILGNRQTHVEFYNSGVNISVNSLLAKDVQTAVTTFGVGIQLQLLQRSGLTAAQAMALAQPVRFTKHVLFNPYINYGYYVAPSFMALMIVIFTILSTIYAIGSELRLGTAAEWLASGNGSVLAALIGKLIPVTIAMSFMSALMYAVLFGVMQAPFNGNAVLMCVATLFFIIAYEAIGIFLISLTDSLRLGLSLGGGYSVLAFTFSGMTFPLMAMDAPLQFAGNFFPYTFFMRVYVDSVVRGAPVAISMGDVAAIVAFWVLPLFVLRRLHRLCSDEKYWGKL